MEPTNTTVQPVQLSPNAFRIHGKPEILLCASLFYFRIPSALWRERMEQLKAFGYNGIDVYFPWNYHELREGEWDFGGEKDVEAFLTAAADAGLWVVARPGPYICSEWDGGALPAYLYAIEGIKLRDHNGLFLHYVSKWYDRILPLLRRFQAGAGGTVICVQLDNELDFYGCSDPHAYISALKDMAIARGITVPLIACAGQGGLREASGLADGVVPTCNFYPNDRDPSFEDKAIGYKELLSSMGIPLLVTETNRSHFLLRRLLSCGAKLLGPYLQVSGTDFGFTNATNNWGAPLAFLTSDYDFGGMISPEGHIRAEAYEGRMLSRIIEAYGAALAEAEPAAEDFTEAAATPDSVVTASRALRLKDGGHLLFVSNVGERAADVVIDANGTRFPKQSTLVIGPGRSLALPYGVPLQTWGIEGTILHSTAELCQAQRQPSKTILVFHTEREGEIHLQLDHPTLLEAVNLSADEKDGGVTVRFDTSGIASCKLELSGGHTLEIIAMDRAKALLIEEIDGDGVVRFGRPMTYAMDPVELRIPWSLGSVPAERSISEGNVTVAGAADYLETYGIYRGYAWYEGMERRKAGTTRKGILLHKGSDVVSVYLGKKYVTTVAPGGGSRYIPTECSEDGGSVTVRTEIWGHTNFDDIRLPGLRLNAMKGIRGLTSVSGIMDLTPNWRVKSAKDRIVRDEYTSAAADDRLWPVVSFGGWLSPDRPSREYFRRSFRASNEADSWTLHFEGIQADADVFIGGEAAGRIHPSDPYLDITPFVEPGEPVQLTVFLEKAAGTPVGKVLLYEGTSAQEWRISSCQEEQLRAHAASVRHAKPVELPVAMNAGEMAWLLGEIKDANEGRGWRVKASGANMKLTVFFNERLIGRLWLPGSPSRPVFTGGSPDSFYIPGPWFEQGRGRMAVLLEAVEGEPGCKLDALSFVPV